MFKQRYLEELSADALSGAQAFVESAADAGGIAIFLCAEEDRPDWDNLPESPDRLAARDEEAPPSKDGAYGHRFALAAAVSRSVAEDHAGAAVRIVRLDMLDFSRP